MNAKLDCGSVNDHRHLDPATDWVVDGEQGYVLASAAHGCEILAVRFARDYDFSADGSSFKKSSVSEMYAKRARSLRARGGTTVISARPVDGYSDDIDSDKVDTVLS